MFSIWVILDTQLLCFKILLTLSPPSGLTLKCKFKISYANDRKTKNTTGKTTQLAAFRGGGGAGGLLLYIAYIGMCRPKGCGF